jgi:hypothetical protein
MNRWRSMDRRDFVPTTHDSRLNIIPTVPPNRAWTNAQSPKAIDLDLRRDRSVEISVYDDAKSEFDISVFVTVVTPRRGLSPM